MTKCGRSYPTRARARPGARFFACVRGEGLEAYRRVHRWYTALSGLGVSDKYAKIMVTPIPKRDSDVANTIEAWETELRDLQALKPELQMPDEFKRTALKRMLTPNVKEYVEAREADLGSYKEMRDLVMDWALRRHRERADVPDVDMGSINQVPESPDTHWESEVPPGLEQVDPWFWTQLNAVGKGKAGGKGVKGGKGTQWGGPERVLHHASLGQGIHVHQRQEWDQQGRQGRWGKGTQGATRQG